MKSKKKTIIILTLIYIFVFISFGLIYWKISLCSPDYFIFREGMGNGSWNLFDFIYFSVVTITTLGYGDIIPNSSLVKLFIMTESIFGVVIMGMLVACIFRDEK